MASKINEIQAGQGCMTHPSHQSRHTTRHQSRHRGLLSYWITPSSNFQADGITAESCERASIGYKHTREHKHLFQGTGTLLGVSSIPSRSYLAKPQEKCMVNLKCYLGEMHGLVAWALGNATALTWVLCILIQKLNKARADEYLCGLLLDDQANVCHCRNLIMRTTGKCWCCITACNDASFTVSPPNQQEFNLSYGLVYRH